MATDPPEVTGGAANEENVFVNAVAAAA